jgi:hypothetical protein
MKPKKLNPGLLWMQFEDVLAPRLGLSVKERAVYSYLLRHSLVVGKLRLQFAVMALARTLGLSIGAARQAVRRLDELGLCACWNAARAAIWLRCACRKRSARSARVKMARWKPWGPRVPRESLLRRASKPRIS